LPANLPRVTDVSIDPIVLAFTLGVSLVSALAGTFPRCGRRGRISRRLRASGRTAGLGSGKYIRQVLSSQKSRCRSCC
jgi:hypothetical protein